MVYNRHDYGQSLNVLDVTETFLERWRWACDNFMMKMQSQLLGMNLNKF
jgi:hypothetical protein